MRLPRKKVKEYLLTDMAVSLYNDGILSFGKARKLCKMTKWDFQGELGRRKVERHYDSRNLDEDFEFADSHQ
jgi:predicted HTH domain antitoxin